MLSEQEQNEIKNLEIYFLKLTGVYGVHENAIDEVSYNFTPAVEGDMAITTWTITSDIFVELTVTIDSINHTITNDYIICHETAQGSGAISHLVCYQVNYALEAKYTVLELDAWRDDENPYYHSATNKTYPYVGYKVWGKYGYLMIDNDVDKFQTLMADSNLPEIKTIGDIYLDTQESKTARTVWDDHGFLWHGTFDLEGKTSESQKVLDRLKKKYNLTDVYGSYFT